MTSGRWNDHDLLIRALAISMFAVAVGIGTLILVRDNPGGSLAGTSTIGGAALLGAGWWAIAAGLLMHRRRRSSRFGPLLMAAGFAWFVTEWNNPGAGSSLVFTLGLMLYVACPPLVAHAALSYPSGRLGSRVERGALAVAYVGALVVLGLGPALAFEPAEQGCSQCATNLVAVTSKPALVASLNRAGVRLGVAWAIALTALAVWRLIRSTPAARRLKAPVLVPAVAYLGAIAATFLGALDRGFVSNVAFDHRLWLLQASTLILVALGVAVEWIRARRARAAVTGMVVDLAQAPPAGGLREALAGTLGDPELQIAYPVGDGRHVEATGAPIEISGAPGRATTALVGDGETVALLVHRADLLGDPRLVEEVASAAGLAFEHERLEAEARAQLEDLRTSRARIVAESDRERQRLERDLHDGAQQRIVGLALAMRLLRNGIDVAAVPSVASRVEAAEAELYRAVDDLRELASGIHPAVLVDLGLAAAIEALGEHSTAPVRLVAAPDERFSSATETAAYLVVAEAARMGAVRVKITRFDGTLVVDVDAVEEPTGLIDLEDRVGSLDGTLTVDPTPTGVTIRAELPCG